MARNTNHLIGSPEAREAFQTLNSHAPPMWLYRSSRSSIKSCFAAVHWSGSGILSGCTTVGDPGRFMVTGPTTHPGCTAAHRQKNMISKPIARLARASRALWPLKCRGGQQAKSAISTPGDAFLDQWNLIYQSDNLLLACGLQAGARRQSRICLWMSLVRLPELWQLGGTLFFLPQQVA